MSRGRWITGALLGLLLLGLVLLAFVFRGGCGDLRAPLPEPTSAPVVEEEAPCRPCSAENDSGISPTPEAPAAPAAPAPKPTARRAADPAAEILVRVSAEGMLQEPRLSVDGVFAGVLPLTTRIRPGEHLFSVRKVDGTLHEERRVVPATGPEQAVPLDMVLRRKP
jgi:hypothetical protein